jgi:hypothetical protein
MAGPWEKYADQSSAPASGPWEKYAAAQEPPKDTRYESFGPLASTARGFEDLTNLAVDPLGLRDEIVGAGAAAKEFVTGSRARRTGNPSIWNSAGEAYSEAAGRTRKQEQQAEEYIPWYVRYPAELVGAVGSAGIAKGFRLAPTLAGRVRQGIISGGEYGGASGFGHSEGGVGSRIEGTAWGAGTGAVAAPLITEVVAPVVGAVARTAGSGARGLGQAAGFVRSRSANVDARLNQALAAQNTPPGEAQRMLDEAQAATKFGKTQLNPQMGIADLGPVTRDLADTAALVSPEARAISGDFLVDRARGQYGRINDYLRRSMQVTTGDFAKTQAKLTDEQQRLSKTAYDAFRNMDVRIPVGDVLYGNQIEDLAAAPALKRTLDQAREQFIAATATRDVGGQTVKQAYTDLSPARFDAGKRAIDDMIGSAQKAGRNNEARLLTTLKKQLVKVADESTMAPVLDATGKPAIDAKTGQPLTESLYAKARDVYGSRAEMLEALDSGRAFMKGDAEITGDQYRALSTGEKRMFRIGIAREVRKALGGKRLGTDMISYFDRPNTREVLGEIMTPKQRDRFYQLVELEQGLAATNNAVRGNSATARRQQNILDFSLGTRLGRMIKDQGLRSALSNEVFDQVTKFFAMRDDDAVALTRALFDTDPAAQRATLSRLAQTYGRGHTRAVINRAQRVLKQRMATMRRTLSGITGEIAGNYEARRSPQPQMQP